MYVKRIVPAARIVECAAGLGVSEGVPRREDTYHIAPLLMIVPMLIPRARNLRLEREKIA